MRSGYHLASAKASNPGQRGGAWPRWYPVSPKGGVRQTDDDPLQSPGYYGSRTMEQPMFAASADNVGTRRTCFRARFPTPCEIHRDTTVDEIPVFIDPSARIRTYISYESTCRSQSAAITRGRAHIEALGLRRRDLNADREKHLAYVRIIQRLLNPVVPDALRSQAIALLAKDYLGRG